MKLFIFIALILGILSFACIATWALINPNYFKLAFPSQAPKIGGKKSDSTDAIIAYYVTRIFLVDLIIVLTVYSAAIVGSIFK